MIRLYGMGGQALVRFMEFGLLPAGAVNIP